MVNTDKPVILCFSGHDPSGGAGISADIEAITSNGCYAMTVLTAVTVQDSQDVMSFSPMPADLIIEQARAVLEDVPVKAIKIGMVGSSEVAEAIYSVLCDYRSVPVIYDPVFSTEKDSALSTPNMVKTVREILLPMTMILTPNVFEVHELAPGSDTSTAAAMGLLESGCEHILLTGTHCKTPDVQHALFSGHRELKRFHYARLPHKYHGSGCTLAASLAAFIALGQDPVSACHLALDYTHKTLAHASRLGMGQLHPNRFYWMHGNDRD